MKFVALSEALRNLADLARFIESSDQKSAAIKAILDAGPNVGNPAYDWALGASEFTPGRTYDYVCAVILLYGILERFIEDVTEEYVQLIVSKTASYGRLPEKMRSTHFDLTVLHLQRTSDSRYDGLASASELTTCLAACLAGEVPYRFISESITHHTANFRTPVIDDFFGRLGISSISRRCVSTQSFVEHLKAVGISASTERPEAALDLVNDLVIRRNQVAHGDINNAIRPSDLLPYCEQVNAYCVSIAELLHESFVGHVAQSSGVDHGRPISVFNNNFVCIQTKGAVLMIGTPLAIQRMDESWYFAEVLGIQIDHADIGQTPAGEDVAVGLKISARCKSAYRVKSISL